MATADFLSSWAFLGKAKEIFTLPFNKVLASLEAKRCHAFLSVGFKGRIGQTAADSKSGSDTWG